MGASWRLGVEARLNTKVGRDIGIDELEASYDAIFWAIGAQKGRGLPVPGWGTENCLTGIEFLDVFNRGWVFSTAKRIVVVGGGDTSIDVASVARRLGHITHQAHHDQPDTAAFGYTAHDVAGVIRREGVKAVLTSLFPVEQMTAAEREREDAKREGIEIKGGVMPLEILRDEAGHAVAIKMCQCTVKGTTPVPVEGTEFHIPCDMVVSAIGQMADLAEGLERLDSGRSAIAIDAVYKVKGTQKHFAGGDAVRPHLLTTAVGHARIAAETITHFLDGNPQDKRPKVDVHHFNLLEELHARKLEPEPYDHGQTRGTSSANFAIHNYEDRSASQIVPHTALFKGHFPYTPRNERAEREVSATQVVGDFNERMIGFTEQQARAEGMRCMSCGLCFECDACMIYCPQKAIDRVPKKERAAGRYVETDYNEMRRLPHLPGCLPHRLHPDGPRGVSAMLRLSLLRGIGRTTLITPHPVLLPQGEGTHARCVIQASLSLWEKDRMRGNALIRHSSLRSSLRLAAGTVRAESNLVPHPPKGAASIASRTPITCGAIT